MERNWQDYKALHTNIEGARAAFEKDYGTLYKKIHNEENVRIVKVSHGDGGIDIYIGNIGVDPIIVIQCKFFLEKFEESQKQQIKDSFKKAYESEFKMKEWRLCIPYTFDLKQASWWHKWKKDMEDYYSLEDNYIKLVDGDDLIDLFKTMNLYDRVFQIENSLLIRDIHKNIFNQLSLEQAEIEVHKASTDFEILNGYFGNNTTTHIDRDETIEISNWLEKDLSVKEKNVLIVKGEKGTGKTIVLRDTLDKLKGLDKTVLAIKADKFYAKNKVDLEKKIFGKEQISFDNIIETFNENGKSLIVIIDQLDALSQSLSSSREFLQTYNRVISDLSLNYNVRIIISTRTFDLEYDAELSLYNANEFRKVEVKPITIDQVKTVLAKFNIFNTSEKFLELLTIPNHLDIFCKLPVKEKLNIDSLSSLKDLYDALWKQLISETHDNKLKLLLFDIAERMYELQQITIPNIFIDEYDIQLKYLKSNNLLLEKSNEIQFFHQTFYDYTFSRQFVEKGKPLLKFIKENKQSLYVRSMIKMVIEYLRDYNHQDYINILIILFKSDHYRFHIKSLVLESLGSMNNPSGQEQAIAKKYILPNSLYAEVFIGSIISRGWLIFCFENQIPEKYLLNIRNLKSKVYEKLFRLPVVPLIITHKQKIQNQKNDCVELIYILFSRNLIKNQKFVVDYLDELPGFEGKSNFINNLLFQITDWSDIKLIEVII